MWGRKVWKFWKNNQQIYKSQHRAIPKPAYLNTNQKNTHKKVKHSSMILFVQHILWLFTMQVTSDDNLD